MFAHRMPSDGRLPTAGSSPRTATHNVIADFTTNLLGGIKPSVARGRDPELMKDLLTRAVETSDAHLRDNPDLNLMIRTIISESLYDLAGNRAPPSTP